jgi:hypothetical protein
VGFATRQGYRRTQPTLTLAPRPQRIEWIREFQSQLFFEYLTDLDNRLLVRTVQVSPLDVVLESGDRASLQVEQAFERLDRGFTIFRGEEGDVRIEAGDYPTTGWEVSLRTAGRRNVFGNVSYSRSGFWSGNRNQVGGAAPAPAPAAAPAAPQAAGGQQARQQGPRAYSQVITSEARTSEGLFKAHTVGDRLFFEIPQEELGRDMLIIGRQEEGGFGTAGSGASSGSAATTGSTCAR